MSKNKVSVKSLHLAHTKEGTIEVFHIEKPHGEYSYPIVKVVIKSDGKKSSIELPYANLHDLIDALKQSNNVCKTFIHNYPHMELAGDVGGGE